MPKVTTLITTFNRSAYLKKAIESVLKQTFEDYELIVLDNSSSDDTESVVRSFADERIRYIKHEPVSISCARNIGVKEARTEFIAYLDDDDEWMPKKLELEFDLFNKSGGSGNEGELALCYGGYIEMDSEGADFGRHNPILRGNILKELLFQKDGFTGSASNPMLRKSVIKKLGGYNEDVPTGEDWELYLRLAEKYRIDFIQEPVVRIRAHAGGRLGDRLEDAAGLEILIMRNFESLFKGDNRLRSFYLQKIGGKFIRVGKIKKGRGFIVSALKADPLNLKAYLQYLLSIMGHALYMRAHNSYLDAKKKS